MHLRARRVTTLRRVCTTFYVGRDWLERRSFRERQSILMQLRGSQAAGESANPRLQPNCVIFYFDVSVERRWRAKDHFSSSMPWPVTAEMA